MTKQEAREVGESKGFGKIKTLEKVNKSKAELFGILASISTKLEELNEADLQFVVGNIKRTFKPDPNFALTCNYDSVLKEGNEAKV